MPDAERGGRDGRHDVAEGVEGNLRQTEAGSGWIGGHHRFGPADQRRTFPAQETRGEVRRVDRFRAAPRRRRQAARRCGQKSEQQRREAHRPRPRALGREPAGDCGRHPARQRPDADCLRRGRDPARDRRGLARPTGNAGRQRHFAERDDRTGALPVAWLRPCGKARQLHQCQGPLAALFESGRTSGRGPTRVGVFARAGL